MKLILDKLKISKKLKVQNDYSINLDLDKLKIDFEKYSTEWKNENDYNEFIYTSFEKEVDLHGSLLEHYKIITKYKLAYGEKAFMYLWPLIVSQIPDGGKFLEIGVYKGSILALTQLCAKELNISLTSFGLTPLSNIGDKYSIYKRGDYGSDISFLYHKLELSLNNTTIIKGLSTDKIVQDSAKKESPFDAVYIDGGHDYDTVINDIDFTDLILKPGGLLIMDDASSLLNLNSKPNRFSGHPEVAYAIRDNLDKRSNYIHLFACGHNRVWKKIN
jgi:hypothetical protein